MRGLGGISAAMIGLGMLAAGPAGAADRADPIAVGAGIYLQSAAPDHDPQAAQPTRSPRPEPRVIGGGPATIQQWPWQASIALNPATNSGNGRDRSFCGGSLITPTMVVTAAHCLERGGTWDPPSDFSVITGRTVLSSADGQEIAVDEYYIFADANGDPLYDPWSNRWDVAVIELASASTMRPIKIAGPDERALWAPGRAAWVTGWGNTSSSGWEVPDDLRAAQVAIVSDPSCDTAYGGTFDATVMVCAAGPGTDSCQGDSGGPLVVGVSGGGHRLVGDTSFGIGCADPDFPGVYGRLADDPIRSKLRNGVLATTGIDVVGSGGQPPGTPSIGAAEARALALAYAKTACARTRTCKQHAARPCTAQGESRRCLAVNFTKKVRRRNGKRSVIKKTCTRPLLITRRPSGDEVAPAGTWTCRRGWV